MRYLDCPHAHKLLVSSMRATMPRERYDIRVCADCGCFFVFAEKEGTYIDVHFTLNTAELVEAAGRYYAEVVKEE